MGAVSYRVFARKYRPQTFEQVVGQDHITRTLQNAIANKRLAQAYLFVGPRGIGKTSTARILAKALNCQNGPTINPCGVCDACREIAEGISLDVLEIDGASNNSVDHIRELRENAAFSPARGPYKIYLVDEVHMLSTAAFNALLKTLEEPPAHVKFIFATTEAQKVPATITSRCQRFDLRRIPAPLIASHLQAIAMAEGVGLEDAAAAAVAKGADGGLRDAESMLDQLVAFCGETITADDVLTVFGFTSRETVDALCGHVFAMDAAPALALVEDQSEAGKDLSRLMADLISHLRDLLVQSAQADAPGDRSIPSVEKLLVLMDHFAEAEGRLRWAADKRLYFDVAVIKAIHLLDQTSLTDVISTLTAIGEGRPPASRQAAKSVRAHEVAPTLPKTVPKSVPLPVAPPPAAPISGDRMTRNEPTAPEAKHDRVSMEKDKFVEPSPKESADEPLPPAPSNDTDQVWREVAEALAAESVIRFDWMLHGKFVELRGDRLIIEFPASLSENTKDFFWNESKKQIESRIEAHLGKRVTFVPEFSGASLPDPIAELPKSSAGEAPKLHPAVPPVPAVDVMEEFRNDPLIQKALKIFKAELEEAKL